MKPTSKSYCTPFAGFLLMAFFFAFGCLYSLVTIEKIGKSAHAKVCYERSQMFPNAAVATDTGLCSQFANNALLHNGSAVDAAITALLCISVINMHTTGLGGGLYMVVWDNYKKKAISIDAQSIFTVSNARIANHSSIGKFSIAVPGFIAGLWEAHLQFGKLPWAQLFQPAIDLSQNGFEIGSILDEGIREMENSDQLRLNESVYLKHLLSNDAYGFFKRGGDRIYCWALAESFKTLANKGGWDFYVGSLSQKLIVDFKELGVPITANELANYNVKINDNLLPLVLKEKFSVFHNGVPSGGPIVAKMIESMANISHSQVWYKHFLGSLKGIYRKVLRESAGQMKSGSTTHVSIVDSFGNAVSVTSSLSAYFGSRVLGRTSGIVFNNAAGKLVGHAMPMVPGERTPTSMSPLIVIDRSSNEPFLVIGASGGLRIITSVAYVASRILFKGNLADEAVDKARLHFDPLDGRFHYEKGVSDKLLDFLKINGFPKQEIDHFNHWSTRSVVQVVQKLLNNSYLAVSDVRKPGGYPAGF